ncbi:TatD family hydrolase [Candidatus Saccharibacteria bacterium]|nr:TatD family hydrolase [Candidatus Saccharibacteria bacterium]
MDLFDTHCHIQSVGLSEGERSTRELWAKKPELSLDQVVKSAQDNKVQQMICVGCDLEDSKLAIKQVQNRGGLYASIGLHPHEAQRYAGQKEALDAFAGLVSRPKVVAVGECGLDYFYEHSPREAQIAVLKFQLELALKHDLPLIFHVREAFDDFWPIFESYQGIRGVLHSFTDSVENMQKATEYGLFIGVNGIATFAKEEEKRVMYRTIPQHLLLLETDAPFLTPVPFRGKVNEPKHTREVAAFLAELRQEPLEALAAATTANAKKLFNV